MTEVDKKSITSMPREEVQGYFVVYAIVTSSRICTPVIMCHHEA